MTTPLWQNPLSNHLLRALPEPEFSRLCTRLEYTPINSGSTLNDPLRGSPYAYFLIDGVAALIGRTESGLSCGTAVIGNEGILGACLVMGDDNIPFEGVVIQSGNAFRLGLDSLRKEFASGGRFQWLVLRHVKTLMFQMAQTAICNGHHPVDRRLSKWLLLNCDRVATNELELTQQFIANILGLRREEVTLAAGRLQDAGLVENRRGRIAILNRCALEDNACECYSLERTAFNRLRADIAPV